jgi:hypothetical protein
MRSLLAALAAAWFIYNALVFIPQGAGVVVNPGQIGGIDGDPGAVAVTWAARTAFVGLGLVALALVEWGKIAHFLTPTGGD